MLRCVGCVELCELISVAVIQSGSRVTITSATVSKGYVKNLASLKVSLLQKYDVATDLPECRATSVAKKESGSRATKCF